MNHKLALSPVVLCLAIGCHTKQSKPTCTVALLDISGSIYPEEVDREFEEMRKHANTMHRGDELILIPIMSNARNDTPGHILQLVAPQSRTAFDSDLMTFRKKADMDITAMKHWAKQNPALHTDILGSLVVAQEQIGSARPENTELLIFSDFLEDDGETDFTMEPALVSTERATTYATQIRGRLEDAFLTSNVSRFQLRSKDAANMTPARLRAIELCWKELHKPPSHATPDIDAAIEP